MCSLQYGSFTNLFNELRYAVLTMVSKRIASALAPSIIDIGKSRCCVKCRLGRWITSREIRCNVRRTIRCLEFITSRWKMGLKRVSYWRIRKLRRRRKSRSGCRFSRNEDIIHLESYTFWLWNEIHWIKCSGVLSQIPEDMSRSSQSLKASFHWSRTLAAILSSWLFAF